MLFVDCDSPLVRPGGLFCGSAIRNLKREVGTPDAGDSGDDPGEGSVIHDEPIVEMVVVGDDSVESELVDEML